MSERREDFVAVHGELHLRGGRLAAGFGYVLDMFGAEAVFAALPPEIGLVFVGHTHVTDAWAQRGTGTTRQVPPTDFVLAPSTPYVVNVGAVGYPRFERSFMKIGDMNFAPAVVTTPDIPDLYLNYYKERGVRVYTEPVSEESAS